MYLTLKMHAIIHILVITGWMDRIDGGFKCKEGGVCEESIG